jgi:hypothetical protein
VASQVFATRTQFQRWFSSSDWKERDPVAARAISGVPEALATHKALIYRPAKVEEKKSCGCFVHCLALERDAKWQGQG